MLLSYFEGSSQCVPVDVDCFDITIPKQPYYEDGNDHYIVCVDKKVTVTPDLKVDYLNKTDRYTVESIPYEPYPYRGGAEVAVTIDQRAATDIDLPFEFCFFDKKFKKLSVHSNGVINFTDGTNFKGAVSDTQPPGANCPNGCNGTDPMNPIPKGGPGSLASAGWLNSVLGVAFHYHITTGPNGSSPAGTDPITGKPYPYSSINYAVYGTAPCRVFVISLANMPAYDLDRTACALLEKNSQTSQIVLHETTNVIDINIERHDGCPYDDRGKGIVGINNSTGTVAYAAPLRNAQHFDARNESWRFGPSGDPLWRLEWYANGAYVGNGLTQDVTISEQTVICSKLIIDGCIKQETDCYCVTFSPDIDLKDLDIEQQIVCDKDQNTFDLLTLNKIVIDNQGGASANLLKFFYYKTEDDAINKQNRITAARDFPIERGENKVWMRIEGRLEECFEIVPIKILKVPVEVKVPKHVNLCSEYTLPPLTDEEFYYKLERLDEDANAVVETLPQPKEGQLINRVGFYRVSIKKTNEYECEDVKSFILFVENCSYPKGISPNGDGDNDVLDLTYNNVVELKVFNRYGKVVFEHGKGYKRQWRGQDSNGNLLPSGTYFLNIKTKNYEYQDWIQLMNEIK
ncbi:gliding motility-associated C-terminal domain-containing protein [Flavobacterium sp. xlx-221]|uniref:T9SS type B sorting domain-containing protein n=2 Tax=unclassified Flavobacterium TaxID=196869 RepID=UPI002106CFA0|nr:gliding motility-associated C-terminal domain-containing protein [Flavobacterium sp. xlx-221]